MALDIDMSWMRANRSWLAWSKAWGERSSAESGGKPRTDCMSLIVVKVFGSKKIVSTSTSPQVKMAAWGKSKGSFGSQGWGKGKGSSAWKGGKGKSEKKDYAKKAQWNDRLSKMRRVSFLICCCAALARPLLNINHGRPEASWLAMRLWCSVWPQASHRKRPIFTMCQTKEANWFFDKPSDGNCIWLAVRRDVADKAVLTSASLLSPPVL